MEPQQDPHKAVIRTSSLHSCPRQYPRPPGNTRIRSQGPLGSEFISPASGGCAGGEQPPAPSAPPQTLRATEPQSSPPDVPAPMMGPAVAGRSQGVRDGVDGGRKCQRATSFPKCKKPEGGCAGTRALFSARPGQAGHWGWAGGGPSGSGGPDSGSAPSASSSSEATPSSRRNTWRTVRVVKVSGPRLRAGETRSGGNARGSAPPS